ncbi:MAG: uroporphyrinogen decarboxylase family protein [Dehalococcoidales bacterium]
MASVISGEENIETEKRLRDEIERKHGKSVEELYQEREKRIRDAIELRESDRVPVIMARNSGTHFVSSYTGVPLSAAYYDPVRWKEAYKKTVLDFEPDVCVPQVSMGSGTALEFLDAKQQKWPGGALPDNATNQFVEGEYMKADEYDHFLGDPSDFVFRRYLPRVYGILEPVTGLPPFRNMIGGAGFTSILGYFLRPEFKELGEKLTKAAQEQETSRNLTAGFAEEMARLGFPALPGGGPGGAPTGAPFDSISDNLRGMRGAMLDMYRCPDKLLAACEKILEWLIASASPAVPKQEGGIVIGGGGALHRGSEGFMSIKQFEEFYWPSFKKTLMAAIKLGYVTSSFCEGIWDDRLEYWLELPKGKAILAFERTDMIKAKEVLGNHACLMGNVPPSLMDTGSPEDVDEYCKKLIKVCGKGGGFILANGSDMHRAKPANVRAMIDSVEKYRP